MRTCKTCRADEIVFGDITRAELDQFKRKKINKI